VTLKHHADFSYLARRSPGLEKNNCPGWSGTSGLAAKEQRPLFRGNNKLGNLLALLLSLAIAGLTALLVTITPGFSLNGVGLAAMKLSTPPPLLIALVLLGIFGSQGVFAGSYLVDYPSGRKLYEYDQCFLKSYPSKKPLYRVDGSHVTSYPSGKRLFTFDGTHLKQYPSGKKLLTIAGQYVKEYPSGRKLLVFDGKYIKEHPSGKRLMESRGIIPRILVALVALGKL